MEEKNTSVTKKIFDILNEKGITQKELSDLTGISTSAISDWKHKGATPSVDKVRKICEVLNINPDQLLFMDDVNEVSQYVISEKDELWEFVTLFHQIEGKERKRILAYVMAMMDAAKNDKG